MLDRQSATTTEPLPERYENPRENGCNLQNTVNALEAFSFSVSHDLRAPLRAIRGFAQALEEDYVGQLDDNAKTYVKKIVDAAGRMDTLIQDVLEYSKVVHSGAGFEPVVLSSIISQVIEDLKNGRGRDALFEVKTPLHVVLGSRCLVQQCLMNLMSNAVKFTVEGQRPHIRIYTQKTAAKVRIYVVDNGIGIQPEFRDKIFQPFRRESIQYEGTGVGLSIVKKAVDRMAGKVGYDSESGKGTTFWIELFAAD